MVLTHGFLKVAWSFRNLCRRLLRPRLEETPGSSRRLARSDIDHFIVIAMERSERSNLQL